MHIIIQHNNIYTYYSLLKKHSEVNNTHYVFNIVQK